MLVLHHLERSRSQRILWLLEELQLPYQIQTYLRDPVTAQAPDSVKKIHLLGKLPLITDGELTLAESGAMIDYLLERYGSGKHLQPEDEASRQQYRYWLHYAEGSLMPLLVMKWLFSRLGQPPIPWIVRSAGRAIGNGMQAKLLDPQLRIHRDYLERHLEKYHWFASDDFSAADIQMSFPIQVMEVRIGLENCPNLQRFLARLAERPAWQRAQQAGGDSRPLGAVDISL